MFFNKKVLSIALSVTAIFGLSSCGGGNSTNTPTVNVLQDDPNCDEVGTENYFEGCTGYSLIDDAELISVPYVPGGTTFDFVHNGAAYPNSLYVVRVDDWSGSIDGYAPDHSIWPNLAVERAVQLFAPGTSVNDADKVLTRYLRRW